MCCACQHAGAGVLAATLAVVRVAAAACLCSIASPPLGCLAPHHGQVEPQTAVYLGDRPLASPIRALIVAVPAADVLPKHVLYWGSSSGSEPAGRGGGSSRRAVDCLQQPGPAVPCRALCGSFGQHPANALCRQLLLLPPHNIRRVALLP